MTFNLTYPKYAFILNIDLGNMLPLSISRAKPLPRTASSYRNTQTNVSTQTPTNLSTHRHKQIYQHT